jgi:glutamate/tyrosine decarboxylase-like PLP-dependent enzyme
MGFLDSVKRWLGLAGAGVAAAVEKGLRSVPGVEGQIEKQYESLLGGMEAGLKPYRQNFPTFDHLPEAGRDRDAILRDLEGMRAREQPRWKEGHVSGAVYHGDDAFVEFLCRAYALHSTANPLHPDVWPSISKFEAEIVAMTANLLGAKAAPGEICGTVTSGGSESILLAIKTYRDYARDKKGITRPEIVAPTTAHPAFDKAAEYFQMRMRRVPVGADYRADVAAMAAAVNEHTVAVVGSAPNFPHGLIDPIDSLSEMARQRGVGFHTDACLGGFFLPWAEKLGYPVPPFDFRLPGVTSMSADTHKYGYTPKGTSVVLYRGAELRRYQYFTVTDWPGGVYFSPTIAGSRPGGLIAACWAAMISIGEQGYLEGARQILETARVIREGIAAIPDLRIIGDPLWVISFESPKFDVYRILDFMSKRDWNLNGLHRPPAVHIALTLRHTQPGVAEKFLADLRDAVEHIRTHPSEKGGLAPVYGMAGTLPFRGVVADMLKRTMDLLYKV